VERTLGDRRLGSHVLGAVELLLPLLTGVGEGDEETIRALFPPQRPDGLEVSTAELMTDCMLAFELAPGSHGLTWPDLPRDGTTLANALEAGTVFKERAPALQDAPHQWTREGETAMGARYTHMLPSLL
jgi:hypothetical protein